jgi:hypothetical protein
MALFHQRPLTFDAANVSAVRGCGERVPAPAQAPHPAC